MTKKLVVKDKDLMFIKDQANSAFHRRPSFTGLTIEETQLFCMLSGFEVYLKKQGIEIPFELQGFVQEDCEPVDDSGSGEA